MSCSFRKIETKICPYPIPAALGENIITDAWSPPALPGAFKNLGLTKCDAIHLTNEIKPGREKITGAVP